jgi:hypothetical protein
MFVQVSSLFSLLSCRVVKNIIYQNEICEYLKLA